MSPATITIGRSGCNLVITARGALTAVAATRLQQFLRECRPPEYTDLYIDLSAADYLDSTFIGLLLALSSRKSHAANPLKPHLVAVSAGAHESLDRMYMLEFFDQLETVPFEPTHRVDLPATAPDADELGQTMIEAHERLIEADDRNTAAFAPVVRTLKSMHPAD